MYFPIDFLIKSTLSMLALLALTLFAIARRWLRPSLELAFVLIPPILYMLVSMGSHLNIGARHILPVYLFCCVIAGAGAAALLRAQRTRKIRERWTLAVIALLIFHIATTVHASPNYISYANEAWGGPTQTYRYLSDSNTDWAQQLIAVSAELRARNMQHCYIAYFATPFILPADYGIPCDLLPTPDSHFTGTSQPTPSILVRPRPHQRRRPQRLRARLQRPQPLRVLPLAPSHRVHPERRLLVRRHLHRPARLRTPARRALHPRPQTPRHPSGRRGSPAGRTDSPPAKSNPSSHSATHSPLQIVPTEARAAYTSAGNKIETMESDARQIWRKKLSERLAALPAH